MPEAHPPLCKRTAIAEEAMKEREVAVGLIWQVWTRAAPHSEQAITHKGQDG